MASSAPSVAAADVSAATPVSSAAATSASPASPSSSSSSASPASLSSSSSSSASPATPLSGLPGLCLPRPSLGKAHDLDRFLVHLHRCMLTPDGIDIVLSVVCYGARLGAVLLSTAAGRALLHDPVRQLVTLVLAAVPSRGVLLTTAVVAPAPSAHAKRKAAAASALALATRLRALGSLMAEARMMLRLWGLLPLYVWARELVAKLRGARKAQKAAAEARAEEAEAETAEKRASLSTAISWTQLVSCVGYQLLENGAYLAQRGVLPWSAPTQDRASRWSNRFFMVYIVAELGRLAGELARRVTDSAEQRAQAAEAQRNLVRYVALAPITAHWGSEKGLLGETPLVLLGSVSAALQMHKLWKNT